MPTGSSSEIQTTALTECWVRYANPCQHDWAFHYINTDGSRGGLRGCAFPSFKYPAASAAAASELAAEIEKLDVPQARSNALKAIGHRGNLLRFVAARTLAGRTQSHEETPAAWWTAHAKYFSVVTNKELARQLLDSWEEEATGAQSYGIEQSRWLLQDTPGN